eukprot:gene1274-1775_t
MSRSRRGSSASARVDCQTIAITVAIVHETRFDRHRLRPDPDDLDRVVSAQRLRLRDEHGRLPDRQTGLLARRAASVPAASGDRPRPGRPRPAQEASPSRARCLGARREPR